MFYHAGIHGPKPVSPGPDKHQENLEIQDWTRTDSDQLVTGPGGPWIPAIMFIYL